MLNKKSKLEPLSDFVFLRFDKTKKTASGIELSDVSKNKPAKAKVLAIGPGRLDRNGNFIKTTLKAGDTVVVNPFLPLEIKVDEEDYLVIRENEIFARI